MSLPVTYRGYTVPILTVEPNLSEGFTLTSRYKTILAESLDTTEERQACFPRPLYGVKFTGLLRDGRDTGYTRRLTDLSMAKVFGQPIWCAEVLLTAGVSAGATSLTVESVTDTLWPVIYDYGILWTDMFTWEVIECSGASGTAITLATALTGSWPAGTRVIPVLFGKLERPTFTNLSDQVATVDVVFEERFLPGLTVYDRIEEGVPPLTLTEPACKDYFELSFGIEDGFQYWVQVAESSTGPWDDLILAQPTESERASGTKTVKINNDYEGAYFFRVQKRDGSTVVYSTGAKNPGASLVGVPTFVGMEGTGSSPVGFILLDNTGLVRPVSWIENPIQNLLDTYIAPAGRVRYPSQLSNPYDLRVTQERVVWSLDNIADDIHWTDDGTEPLETTVNPARDGVANSAGAYRRQFGLALKARCWRGGCPSPYVVILVDKLVYARDLTFISCLQDFASSYAACDLPKADGTRSGADCDLVYGGQGAFDAALTAYACAAKSTGNRDFQLSYSDVRSVEAPTSFGWNGHYLFVTDGEFNTTVMNRGDGGRFDPFPFCFSNIVAGFNSLSPSYVQGSTDLMGIGGTITAFKSRVDQLFATVAGPGCPNSTNELSEFHILCTLADDFFPPPTTPDPDLDDYVPPPDPPAPAYKPDGDDFEDYLEGTPSPSAPLSAGQGMSGSWEIAEAYFGIGYESWDYPTGTDETAFIGGTGWFGGWAIETTPVWYSHNFDTETVQSGASLPDLSAIPVVALTGGTGWSAVAGEESWVARPSPIVGYDSFDSYAEGTPTPLDGGVNWAGDSDWEAVSV